MLKQMRQRGQSLAEYMILLIVIMAAYLAMSNYMKRGLQGRWKEAADELGEQYDPRFADSAVRHTLVSTTQTTILAVPNANGTGLWTQRTDVSNVIEAKTGIATVGAF